MDARSAPPAHRQSWDSLVEVDPSGNTLPIYDGQQPGFDALIQAFANSGVSTPQFIPSRPKTPSQSAFVTPLARSASVHTISRPPSYIHDPSQPFPVYGDDIPGVPVVPQQYQQFSDPQWSQQMNQQPFVLDQPSQPIYGNNQRLGSRQASVHVQSNPAMQASSQFHVQPFLQTPNPSRSQHQQPVALNFYNSAVGSSRNYGRALPALPMGSISTEPMGGAGTEVQAVMMQRREGSGSTISSYGSQTQTRQYNAPQQQRQQGNDRQYVPYEPQFSGNQRSLQAGPRNGQVIYPSQPQQSLPPRSFAASQQYPQPSQQIQSTNLQHYFQPAQIQIQQNQPFTAPPSHSYARESNHVPVAPSAVPEVYTQEMGHPQFSQQQSYISLTPSPDGSLTEQQQGIQPSQPINQTTLSQQQIPSNQYAQHQDVSQNFILSMTQPLQSLQNYPGQHIDSHGHQSVHSDDVPQPEVVPQPALRLSPQQRQSYTPSVRSIVTSQEQPLVSPRSHPAQLSHEDAYTPRTPSVRHIIAQSSASPEQLAIHPQADPSVQVQSNETVSSPYDQWPPVAPPTVAVMPPSPETQISMAEAFVPQPQTLQQVYHNVAPQRAALSPVSEEQEEYQDNVIPEMETKKFSSPDEIFARPYQLDEEGDTYSEYQPPPPSERVYAPSELDIEEEDEEELLDWEDRMQKTRSRKKLQAILGETFGPRPDTPPQEKTGSGRSRKSTPSVHSEKTQKSRSLRDSGVGQANGIAASSSSVSVNTPLPAPKATQGSLASLSLDERSRMMKKNNKFQTSLGDTRSIKSPPPPEVYGKRPLTARSDVSVHSRDESLNESQYSSTASSFNPRSRLRQSSSSSEQPYRTNSISSHTSPLSTQGSSAPVSSPLSPIRESSGRVLTQALNKLSMLKPTSRNGSKSSISHDQHSSQTNRRAWGSLPLSRDSSGLFSHSNRSEASIASKGTFAIGTS